MKLKISESLLAEIDSAIKNTAASADVLQSTLASIESFANERTKEQGRIDEIGAVPLPSEKQVNALIVARERRTIIDSALAKFNDKLDAQKVALLREIHDANELFRSVAGPSLIDQAREELFESLPPSVKVDQHRIWAESSTKRALGQFLNQPAPSSKDAGETVLAEASRISQLLADLLRGNEIVAFASSPAETAAL